MKISVTHNLKAVSLAYKDLADKYVNQATVRALNKTATTVRAEAARKIGREYNIKIGAAKSQMWISRANRGRVMASITVSGRPIPLVEFDARQTRRGVTVKVKGTRKVVAGAFIATMKTGHRGVYVRSTGKRLPIRQLFSLSLPVAFSQKQIMDALLQAASARFAETLRQEVRYAQLKAA
jgi:hypothetical protein